MATSTYIRRNYRLYPTKDQEAYFRQEIGNQRFVWNHYLDKNIEQYEKDKTFIFGIDCIKNLTKLKMELEFEWLNIGNAQSLQQTLRDFDQALKQSFKSKGANRKGFPKFKRKGSGGSFRIPQGVRITESGKLKLPKIGEIKMVDNGNGFPAKFKSVTIVGKPSGKWYASFVVPYETPDKVEITPESNIVGIDLNSHYFAVTSDGDAVVNPKHLKDKEKRLKRYQRRYSRCAKGSKNQERYRKRLAIQHEKVSNQRKDFINKVTTSLVKAYDVICLEDLNVKAMQRWNGRMIQNAPFAQFRSNITWKANKFGKHVIVIDRYDPTSKMCHSCGSLHDMPVSKRRMECSCGNSLHRDHNAAINIRQFGLIRSNIGWGPPESTPLETLRLQDSNTVRWESLKEETLP